MKSTSSILLVLTLIACSPASETSWCSQPLRPEFSAYNEITPRQAQGLGGWFRVFEVGEGVYAIAEPHNFQEVISYLIIGSQRNILFDTGMGMGRISEVVKELSSLPVTVINSHTHYDHIGGNIEFDSILAVDNPYTRKFSTEGWSHELVRQEVSPSALCLSALPQFDTANYAIKPFADKVFGFISDGDSIQLGNRTLEVLHVPGHTPDCIALLDRANGYLWTGDMYYEATIWLFFDGTDLDAYRQSIARFATLAPKLQRVFPAHNTPAADPANLLKLQQAFEKILTGTATALKNPDVAHPEDSLAVTFEFEKFNFRIRRDELVKKGLYR